MKLVKLHFQGGLRAGAPGWGLEEEDDLLRADVLYSGLTLAMLDLYGRVLPEMRLSSAFPFVDNRYFLPRPMLPFPSAAGAEISSAERKALRRMKFVEHRYFLAWVQGEVLDLERVMEGADCLTGALRSVLRPRVALDRERRDSALYFVAERRFSQDSGLYCLVECPEESWPEVAAAFRMLGEVGVGGERALGLGCFVPEFLPAFQLPPARQGGRCVTLAPLIPRPGEEAHLERYRLMPRGGWVHAVGASVRKKKVHVVAEGSILRCPVQGMLADVAPAGWPHPVWRYGLGFFVGVR